MMNTTAPIRFVRPRPRRRDNGPVGNQLIAAAVIGTVLFLIIVLVVSLGYQTIYAGKIFPGVSIAGVDVSGLSEEQAAFLIKQKLTFPQSGRIVFKNGTNIWIETPENLGLKFDIEVTTRVAYDLGRTGNIFLRINDQLNAAQIGIVAPPVIVFDQKTASDYLKSISYLIEKPVVEAGLEINGLDVISRAGQVGQKLDIQSTLIYLHAQLQAFRDGEVPLVLSIQAPQVIDAGKQAESAKKLLSAPFYISLPDHQKGDPGPWQIQPAELALMLRVGRAGSGPGSSYVIQIDREKLQTYLETIVKQVDRQESDARFVFDDQSGLIKAVQPSVIGLQVDRRGSYESIQKTIADGFSTAALVVNTSLPKVVDTATNQQLGITQLISSQTTYFYGSTEARKKNIETAASRFNGLLVAPGDTFSMGQHMGDVSLDSGFAEALIIFNGKTIKGVGGGVCQVSTTLFRSVFYAGLPVVERHAHAYRVKYYEQGPGGQNDPSLSGFDATVYFPLVDFRFKNDTPYWILMETFYDSANYSLTWKLYSTPDGRSVNATFSGPTNIMPALQPRIAFNPDAEPGSVSHVDYAAEGADITINRVVMKGGGVFFTDNFTTNYQPWADVCEYGPDVKNPEKILKKKLWCQKS